MIQLFYNTELNQNSEKVFLSEEESRHMLKVLRKKIGDKLHITNGNGGLFLAEIFSITAKSCQLLILTKEFKAPLPYKLHLAVAPTKMNDRYEWFLEKATEIGVTSITPIICDRSERKFIKLERFKKIIISAMKQSLHYYLPDLQPPISFSSFVNQNNSTHKFIAHCEESQRQSLKSRIKPNKDTTILIGPEGDFSPNEIKMARQNQYIPVTLGTYRLRTETAAIVACHNVAFVNDN